MKLKYRASHWNGDKLTSVWYWEINDVFLGKYYSSEEDAWKCRHPEVKRLKHGY